MSMHYYSSSGDSYSDKETGYSRWRTKSKVLQKNITKKLNFVTRDQVIEKQDGRELLSVCIGYTDHLHEVSVYTINQESKYIIVNGVSSVGVSQELSGKLSAYGYIAEYRKLDDYPTEDFTEVYLVKYEKISNARF
ncbi:hypothetical protein QZH41_009388, partial [Actinostola sp. cb2023]